MLFFSARLTIQTVIAYETLINAMFVVVCLAYLQTWMFPVLFKQTDNKSAERDRLICILQIYDCKLLWYFMILL